MGDQTVFNEAHLMEALAVKGGADRVEALSVIEAWTLCMTDALRKGEPVTLSGFGTFRAADNSTRGRGKRYVNFRAGSRLRVALNDSDD
jgi:nucleoid DNA-binding protein